MARPLVLVVDDDLERLGLVRRGLLRRYQRDYKVVCVSATHRRPSDSWMKLHRRTAKWRWSSLIYLRRAELSVAFSNRHATRLAARKWVALLNWGRAGKAVL